MRRQGGFTLEEKMLFPNKINEIRISWNDKGALLEKLTIPFTGQKIRCEPEDMMKFREQDGFKRFFRIKDQLKVANNSSLKFLQTKLNSKVRDEGEFYGIHQEHIEYNELREQRVKQSGRNQAQICSGQRNNSHTVTF